MKERLVQIESDAERAIAQSANLRDIEEARLRFWGKKGELTAVLRGMAALTPEERPAAGQLVNEARARIEARLSEAEARLTRLALEQKIAAETLDITLPGKRRSPGHKHPITLATEAICETFLGMGYQIAEGPEIEIDHFNFELLNIPKDHPARDTQDTFYIDDDVVLRTHTSPVQVRTMLTRPLPIKIICPGRVYRVDTADATHSPVFHQIEGLVVDRGITMGDLVGALSTFAKNIFGEDTKIRLRPHHFQFTEPSAEVDVTCWECGGKGCRLCKNEGFIELLGAGVVNPKVLKMCGIDPEVYSGFAFGLGIERVATCKYNINSMRLLYENDIRFLRQF
ncbi:MAG: phenylalanine--tRNA ligase subunit alpha [Clostridiales bacterium]|jgi:phenylalanyl-tRNA synthetase alpha chain|nr:phenylalanine--tRNA ligase subunit alpha [Clostridiales bacterium]